MKSIISKSLTLILFCTALFAFKAMPGGESFEILLNNELLVQKHGNEMNSVKSIRLNEGSQKDQLAIKYNHCGRTAKNRIITIRNVQNEILQLFRFDDVATPYSPMVINVKDLVSIKKANGNNLKMYYSSTELTDGRQLATVQFTDAAK
jgi:hypothetical protein